jgi:hypothetical protein
MEGIKSEVLSAVNEFRSFRDQVNLDTRDYREYKGKTGEQINAHESRLKVVEDRINWILVTVIVTLAIGLMNLWVSNSR